MLEIVQSQQILDIFDHPPFLDIQSIHTDIHSTYMHMVTFTMHVQAHHAVAPKGT